MWILLLFILVLLGILFKHFNRDYYILAGCKRIKTFDGSELEKKVEVIKGSTIFGNNIDIIGGTPASIFQFARKIAKIANGRSAVLNILPTPIYWITNAEDAEEVLQSQALIKKGRIYKVIQPFMGMGLLTSTAELWQFRRKLLTPAYHFKILQLFVEIFKEESQKTIKYLNEIRSSVVNLSDIIPQFTLNNICETALGVKLDDIPGSDQYRHAVDSLEPIWVHRVCNPILTFDFFYKPTLGYKKERQLLNITHNFSSRIIEKRRIEFANIKQKIEKEEVDEYGKKQRYAMLDTLLEAELQGLIDHQGICDEVNTFMFEGYDTTSVCLKFSLFNLATHQDIQQKCYEEIEDLALVEELAYFDFNKLEYLECVIKETLRLYPSVPFLARGTVKETVVNGLVLPPNSDIFIHTYDIMRDEKHFPEPNKFNPERFRAENTTNRHPFVFVPFSAGPRNCIGQKFAMLEVKVLLVAILKNFIVKPVTTLDEITFENGLVLRTKEKLEVKVISRNVIS